LRNSEGRPFLKLLVGDRATNAIPLAEWKREVGGRNSQSLTSEVIKQSWRKAFGEGDTGASNSKIERGVEKSSSQPVGIYRTVFMWFFQGGLALILERWKNREKIGRFPNSLRRWGTQWLYFTKTKKKMDQ